MERSKTKAMAAAGEAIGDTRGDFKMNITKKLELANRLFGATARLRHLRRLWDCWQREPHHR